MGDAKEIVIDGKSALFDRTEMHYKEFSSDFRQIRYYTLLIVQKAPLEIKELNLLEQQISELIKNAVKHGNRMDSAKKIRVWSFFSSDEARLIVQDEGAGFQDLEKWNDFNRKRTECFNRRDFSEMTEYVSYRTQKSDEADGGNALFAALEYWNAGFVFDEARTSLAVRKTFHKKVLGIERKRDGR